MKIQSKLCHPVFLVYSITKVEDI